MRKKSLLFTLVLVSLLVTTGCSSQKREAYYGFFGLESMVLVVENKHLVVMSLPSDLVNGYAISQGLEVRQALPDLLGIPAKAYFGGDEASLREARSLVTTLAGETLGIPRSEVTDELSLSVLQTSAGDLRKTPFVSTLELLTGLPDALALLQKMKACHTYDVRQFVTIDNNTDWKVLKDYLSQWLSFALLLE
ncbi:MAG TPA: hypothetical protein VJ863_11885 [Sphaerochaeta sp.]|nr:hypothetical protein [Sphaerochaeta sp.]